MSYVSAKVCSWADAQDIVQDTFLDELRGLGGFDLGRPFRPWLRAICRNRLSRHYRAWAREQARCLSLSDENVARRVAAAVSEETDPGESEELIRLVRACMARLNRRHAELLWLRYGEDLSLAEVARRCGRSPHCLAQTLYRVRGQLKQAIELRLKRGVRSLPSLS